MFTERMNDDGPIEEPPLPPELEADIRTLVAERGANGPINRRARRRWFQFTFGTLLFGMTSLGAVCAYVTQQATVVKARQTWLKNHIAPFLPCDKMMGVPKEWPASDQNGPTLLRSWLGDETRSTIELHDDATSAEVESAKRLFPEAKIIQFTRSFLEGPVAESAAGE